ncbi:MULTISPECIES: ABC transporter permease [Marivita]|jgi:peptide/nickel transport system permease protein|uniref:ABC transporter permease n=1 Tax=Marivita cryptomonadis TaxID=505252 RepID=A0A9Q2NZC8_9RHOB|nr:MULTISPECIES: ABC transporter permease [Marivita]MCR9169303.1 ABC transporter permease [Paracoccaceae bacterium]MBM2324032.1 ABC transporter permease [Marivita cryptomonadis]MBM2333622.1 ABC transporter permease [Marivita cryptomonadis]MBM2343199.1 ABC transporter permease [Marivita cryptomonadis]MBM2347871.1 ABC transporter permease [Marivita cryptomonadis]
MAYFLKRFAHMIFVLWAVATILFFMFRTMPGTPLAAFIDNTTTLEQQEALIRQFGLDRSLGEQYWRFLTNLVQGDLGQSFFFKKPVVEVVMEVFPNSVILTLTSLIIAYIFGIVAGAYLAWRRGSWVEGLGIPLVLTTRAAPEFWLGMVLLAYFSFHLGWFPSGGANSSGSTWDSNWQRVTSLDYLSHLALPAITLAIYLQGLPLLLMRSNMLNVLQEEFITMARMKGLSTWTIVMRHAARNALLPVATAFALGIGGAVGGNVVVETVFSWPGIGRLLVNAVAASDYPLAQGAFLMITAVLVVMNFIADVTYHLLDPRVRVATR